MDIFSWFLMCIVALCSYVGVKAGGGGGHHHHVKIIVPYHVKTIKHTHTIYKTIHHGGGGGGGGKYKSKEEVLGHSHGGKPFHWH